MDRWYRSELRADNLPIQLRTDRWQGTKSKTWQGVWEHKYGMSMQGMVKTTRDEAELGKKETLSKSDV